MGVAFDPRVSQISAMKAAKSVSPAEKGAQTTGQVHDKMEISQKGQQTAAELKGLEPGSSWELLELDLEHMTKDEWMSVVREQLREQTLEVNWNATVDPDGQIWCKAYFDSYVSQVTQFRDTAERAIQAHYADAFQEALHSPLGQNLSGQLNFLAGKYQCSWSDYYDDSIPAGERYWTYTQVRAMLTGSGLRLNDPFALNDIHIPTSEETSKTARQAANDQINLLIRQAREANGITD